MSGSFIQVAGHADVVELVDTLDLGSSAARCESSSLSVRTIQIAIQLAENGAVPEEDCAVFVSGDRLFMSGPVSLGAAGGSR